MTYGEIAVDNDTNIRSYVEVMAEAHSAVVSLHAEDEGHSAVQIDMSLDEVMELIAKLTEAVKTAL